MVKRKKNRTVIFYDVHYKVRGKNKKSRMYTNKGSKNFAKKIKGYGATNISIKKKY